MSSPHKNAPLALLNYYRHGRLPVKGIDYLSNPDNGKSPNLKKEYWLNAGIAKDKRSLAVDRITNYLVDELFNTGLCKTEFGSPTYTSTHVVFAQSVQAEPWIPDYTKHLARKWLDYHTTVERMCFTTNRNRKFKSNKNDRLKAGPLVEPPANRAKFRNNKPTRETVRRTISSWAHALICDIPYKAKWNPSYKASGPELDLWVLLEMQQGGLLYKPVVKNLFHHYYPIILASPIKLKVANNGKWIAAFLPRGTFNKNGRVIKKTAGFNNFLPKGREITIGK